jgi:hypothetical protein
MLAQSVAVEIDAKDVTPLGEKRVVTLAKGSEQEVQLPQRSSLAGD